MSKDPGLRNLRASARRLHTAGRAVGGRACVRDWWRAGAPCGGESAGAVEDALSRGPFGPGGAEGGRVAWLRRHRVCNHPDRDAIDEAIDSQVPNRPIAELHRVSGDSIRRHAQKHLPKMLVEAAEIQAIAAAEDLPSQAQKIREEALQAGARATRPRNGEDHPASRDSTATRLSPARASSLLANASMAFSCAYT